MTVYFDNAATTPFENDEKGNLDIEHLEELLKTHEKTFVSVMHGNNEIGNIHDTELNKIPFMQTLFTNSKSER